MPSNLTSEQYKRRQHLKQVAILRKAGLPIEECAVVLDATVHELRGYLKGASVRGEYKPGAKVRQRWIDVAKMPYGVNRWLIAECRRSGVSVEEMVFAIINDAHAEETQGRRK